MSVRVTNPDMLARCYKELAEKIAVKRLDDKAVLVPFHSGVALEQEGYKYKVYEDARRIVDAVPWNEPGLIGRGIIKDAILKALGVKDQNLVEWSDIIYFDDLRDTRGLEKALFNLFTSTDKKDDERLFGALLAIIKNKYAILSFLFFLKDCNNYMVMRPDNFAWRLKRIGVKENCTHPATWQHYSVYMKTLKEVHSFLMERNSHYENVTLLDAHSFVWMLWMIENEHL